MANGSSIPQYQLDDRTWQDIVRQARDLSRIYLPDWQWPADLEAAPTDLGLTLVHLFARMMADTLTRLNQVPDKHFIEFLNLLGITRDPPTPASTSLSYEWLPSKLPITKSMGVGLASTPETEKQKAIVFETDRVLTLPTGLLTTVLFADPQFQNVGAANTRYKNVTKRLVKSPFVGMPIEIGSQNSLLNTFGIYLGFEQANTSNIELRFHFSKTAPKDSLGIVMDVLEAESWNLIAINDGTNNFQQTGIISFTPPQSWVKRQLPSETLIPLSSADRVDSSLYWLLLRVINRLEDESIELELDYIQCNGISATNALTIRQPELLYQWLDQDKTKRIYQSNGQPYQTFELDHAPLYKHPGARNPYDHLRVQVHEPQVGGGFGPWQDWPRLDDESIGFPLTVPKNSPYFRLNPVTATLTFGSYDPMTNPQGHGRIPPVGSEIRAVTYRYVAGGVEGNLPADTITLMRNPQPGMVAVTNPGPTTGGSDEESEAETKRRGPEVLRNHYRAVTAEDYEYLAREATTDVKKARCLTPRLKTDRGGDWDAKFGQLVSDPNEKLERTTGNVNVIIIPDGREPRPWPSEALIQEVTDYLNRRRPPTCKLKVTGPRYLPINVTVQLTICPQALEDGLVSSSQEYMEQLKARIEAFLHPVWGGADGTGWEIGQSISKADVMPVVQIKPDIGYVTLLTIATNTTQLDYIRSYTDLTSGTLIELPTPDFNNVVLPADFETMCSGTVTVTQP